MITYSDDFASIDGCQTDGFFVGWPTKPDSTKFRTMLTNSQHVALAIDESVGRLVGFVNAHSDGVVSAYIPLLEVLPGYQGKGIGTKLMHLILDQLTPYYMIDLTCDDDVLGFYASFNMMKANSLMLRNPSRLH